MEMLPKRLKIGGIWYDIEVVDCSLFVTDKEGYMFGLSNFEKHKIMIDKSLDSSQVASTLLHEIIEVINSTHECKLEHRTICTLEASLYQVLIDNQLNFCEE
jgi:hypothetical protein